VLFGVLFLRQTQLAGARDSFGAPLDLEFAKDLPIEAPNFASRISWPINKLSGSIR